MPDRERIGQTLPVDQPLTPVAVFFPTQLVCVSHKTAADVCRTNFRLILFGAPNLEEPFATPGTDGRG